MRHRTRAAARRPTPARHRRLNAAAGLAAAALVAGLLSPAAADDRDLLRFDSAKPYLFIVLDTSASMAMKMGVDEWAPGGADGPDSRLYQAKQALFNVLQDVRDVHLGFAGYNQDGVHVTAKHWLYYNDEPLANDSSWPIPFPREDVWDVDGDGSVLTRLVAIQPVDEKGNPLPVDPDDVIADTRVTEIGDGAGREADLVTFGPSFPGHVVGGRVVAGTCSAPLDLGDDEDRDRLQSFAIAPSGANPTWFWLRDGNKKYLLSVSRPGKRPDDTDNAVLGQDRMHIVFELRTISNCNSGDPFAASPDFTLRRNLRTDEQLSQFFYVNQGAWGPGQDGEATAPVWEHSDVVSRTSFQSSPHSGFGWEGNYDSGIITADETFNDSLEDSGLHHADYCPPNQTCLAPAVRVKPQAETVEAPVRALDKGDMVPFDWDSENKIDVLSRLDPEFDGDVSTLGDFRIARHFADTPVDGALPLAGGAVPLLAADVSPLARALTDVRCWYLGATGQQSQKCKETTFNEARFAQGWSQVACGKDSAFGCRRNFLIVISDGEDNVAGQNANGSIGNLKNSANMQTWALNVGDPNGCRNNSSGGLHSIVRAGGGECINVSTQTQLRQVLEALLGQIRTTARSFASAAVPSVQATVDQKIFLTSFLPFNDSPVWKGSVHSFLKPLPVSPAGIPLTDKKCDGTGEPVEDPTQECHLWDAGQLMLEKQYPDAGKDYLDLADLGLRRVFHSLRPRENGEWPRNMRLFDPISIDTEGSRPVRFDLWRAMRLPFTFDDTDGANQTAETNANAVIDFALRVKTGTERNTDAEPPVEITHELLLGDIFHSTPVVVGTPANTLFFANDLYGNGAECDPEDGTADANPGYRCFFEKQRFRRKMLIVGSNDGMLHAFDAGMFRTAGTDHWTGEALVDEVRSPFGSFDNGTGKELFAYVPRIAMFNLRQMREGIGHQFSVDGTVTVADVFIDPVAQADAFFPEEGDRQWRTVVIGGLREGGTGYFALDITQPDPVVEHEGLGFVPVTHDSSDNDPDTGDFVPVCTANLKPGEAGILGLPSDEACGPVPFPAALWEFTDSLVDPDSGRTYVADEEKLGLAILGLEHGNLRPDLADTWSTPSIGRIRLCAAGGTRCDPTPDATDPDGDADLVDVFVAVVGGGMDTDTKEWDWRDGLPFDRQGNWLYIIDIETGEAIYKRELIGAVPSEPAAVDTNGDGYLDRIYVGTLAGILYRVDLGPALVEGNDVLPALEPVSVRHFTSEVGFLHPEKIKSFQKLRVPEEFWAPVPFFDTNHDGATPSPHQRAIYHRPSVIFQAGGGNFALAFGTGDRHDLWSVDPLPDERFYVVVDDFESADAIAEPLDESDLVLLTPTSPESTTNLLATAGGWAMDLAPKERVITDAFALSGVTVFSTFVPRTEDGTGNETVVGCEFDQQSSVCSKQGLSHVFVVNTTNGNGLLFEGDSDVASRFNVAPTFVTNPFAEPGQTQDAVSGNEEGEHTADDLSPNMVRVMESLKELFPPQCKFANYRIDIKTVAADTSLQFIAPIPVCLIESNWKEF